MGGPPRLGAVPPPRRIGQRPVPSADTLFPLSNGRGSVSMGVDSQSFFLDASAKHGGTAEVFEDNIHVS